MESFWGIFGDWMKQDTEGSKWFQSTYGEKIAFADPRYRKKLIDVCSSSFPTIRSLTVSGRPNKMGNANSRSGSMGYRR